MKKETIQAILIDPFSEKVTRVETGTSLEDLYNILQCDTITIVGMGFGARAFDMIMDDEGLLKDRENQRYFKYKLFSQPYAGRALLTFSNKEGDTTSVGDDVMPHQIEKDIIWYKPSKVELEATLAGIGFTSI